MSLLAPMFLFPSVLLLVLVIPALFMWLWNLTMPEVFGLRPIQFWQAFRLILLAAMVFGGARLL